MPILDFGDENRIPGLSQVNCHLLCRCLASEIPRIIYRDGYFTPGYEHSWLETNDAIIDAYPVAGATPFIVANDPASPWAKLYKVGADSHLQKKLSGGEFYRRLDMTNNVVVRTLRAIDDRGPQLSASADALG
jgi:hypothetical protein